MTTFIFDEPTGAKEVTEYKGTLQIDPNLPETVSPLDVDLLQNKVALPPIDYTNLDFSSIKLQLLNLLKANAKNFGYSLRDFSDANTAGMLLNMTAFTGQLLSYHADSLVNELFLETAQTPWAVSKLLSMYGYKMSRPQPGVILLAVTRRRSTSFSSETRALEDASEILFSSSTARKRFSFGQESFEIFPAKDENGALVPDLFNDMIIPAYKDSISLAQPDEQVSDVLENTYFCFGLTGVTRTEDFISNGQANQVITLGSGPISNSPITVYVEDPNSSTTSGKRAYTIWTELSHLPLAGFRVNNEIKEASETRPYLISSFKLSEDAYFRKLTDQLPVGTILQLDYNNELSVADYEDFIGLTVPYQTCILTSLGSTKYNDPKYVDVILYHPNYSYSEASIALDRPNYFYSDSDQKIYWAPGDILYLYTPDDVLPNSEKVPQLISDTQIALASKTKYPRLEKFVTSPDIKIAVGRALSDTSFAFGLSADIDSYIESDSVYEVSWDGTFFAKVRFGDGIFGKIPPKNSAIKIVYRVSGDSGTGSIVRVGQANQVVSVGNVDLVIRNDYESSPASFGESLATAKLLAPRFLASQDRAVTGSDYTLLVKKYNSDYKITSALAKADADGSIVRLYTLTKRQGASLARLEPLTMVEKLQLRNYLTPYKCLGTEIEIADGIVRTLDLKLDIVVKSGYVTGQVKSDLRAAIVSFFDVTNQEMGVGFKTTEFIKYISSIPGLDTFSAYFGSLPTISTSSDIISYGSKSYSLIKDIPSYSLGEESTVLQLESQEVSRPLLPYEILVLDSLIINTVSA